jgi:hypothetical protein
MKQLETISVVAPGFAGLNLQESPVTLNPTFALVADNCIIDKSGRVGSRKGWTQKTVDGDDELDGEYIEFLHEHVNAGNTTTVISGGNLKLFENGVGSTLTDITPAGYTATRNNWKAATLLDYCFIVQDDHEPIVYTAGTATDYTTFASNTPNFGSNTLRDVIAAYGRFWAHDGNTVYWSTDIADSAFPEFYDGSSGTLNIASVLPDNTDNIVALAAHNNLLFIFCERNIVIYKGADDILSTDFQLEDIITGVGCVARDSIQNTGADIIFLSDTGIRSLGRLIQEKSLPMRDLTKNVRDQFLAVLQNEIDANGSLDGVKSLYSERYAFYLITFPSIKRVYVLDMRQALEDGSARVTNWISFPAKALLRRRNRDIMFGMLNGIGQYEGYSDNGARYRMKFFTNYLDFGAPTVLKMVKKIKATVIGGSMQDFVFKLGYDYIGSSFSFPFRIPDNGPYEYNIDEYMDAQYTGGLAVEVINSPGLGSGNVIQIGFECNVDGSPVSVQKVDLFVKTGKLS